MKAKAKIYKALQRRYIHDDNDNDPRFQKLDREISNNHANLSSNFINCDLLYGI